MAQEQKERKVGTGIIKCSGCGANMVFEPNTQTLVCPHCGTKKEFVVDKIAKELDVASAFSKDKKWDENEVSLFSCSNCGAKIILSNGETAKKCPFCGTAHVEKIDEMVGLKPNAVVPFQFDINKAEEISRNWAKKKAYAPKEFKRTLSVDNIKGVYTPCFTFDSATTSRYYGRIGETRTRTVGFGKNRRTETYVVWRDISGEYSLDFNDVLITAGTKLDQKKLDKISPFDTDNSKVYQENFLLGFMAYRYDREIVDCWGSAKQKMDSEIRKGILSQYNYDQVQFLNVSTSHEAVTYKYVMLPVYLGSFNYKQKLYNYYINGETGKIYGKTPKSPLKIFLTVLAGLAVIGGIIAALVLGDVISF